MFETASVATHAKTTQSNKHMRTGSDTCESEPGSQHAHAWMQPHSEACAASVGTYAQHTPHAVARARGKCSCTNSFVALRVRGHAPGSWAAVMRVFVYV